jgi:mRNA interferase RelE/StbE
MHVQVNKKFLKELSLLPYRDRLRIERFLFEELPNLSSPAEIPNLSKLKGYKEYFKIRIGDYRIGLRIKEDNLIFERVLHRKDIYRYYP